MKQLTIIVLITILTASKGISQNSNDSTTCLPNTQLKKVINRLETCKVIEEELNTTKEQVGVLNNRINLKDSIIHKYTIQNDRYVVLIDNYAKNITNQQDIITNQKKAIALQKKAIRRQKLSKYVAGIIGISVGYLITK